MWTEEDSRKCSQELLQILLTDPERHIEVLGLERYDSSIAELKRRIARDLGEGNALGFCEGVKTGKALVNDERFHEISRNLLENFLAEKERHIENLGQERYERFVAELKQLVERDIASLLGGSRD